MELYRAREWPILMVDNDSRTPAEIALWILADNAGGHIAFDSSAIRDAREIAGNLAFRFDPVSRTYFVEALSNTDRRS